MLRTSIVTWSLIGWPEIKLPLGLIILFGVLGLVALIVLYQRKRQLQSTVEEQFKQFREQAVGLMDQIDRLRQRHKTLPSTDPDFVEPMTGATKALYDQVSADLERMWERWLGVMEVWNQAEQRMKSASTFGVKPTEEAKKPSHSVAARAVAEALAELTPDGYFVTREDPIRIGDASEPEPDAAVVRGKSRDYARRHPDAAQVALVVEVSDSSLNLDRTEKMRAYAAGGIPIYWIVNLVDDRLEVYSQPESGTYQNIRSLDPTEAATVVVDGRELGVVTVADLLP